MKIMKITGLVAIIVTLTITSVSAQNEQDKPHSYLNLSWEKVATDMPAEWYNSDEAKRVAENVLLSQKDVGGWEKNKPYHHIFSESEKTHFIQHKSEIGATFDNGATITELRFLANVYSQLSDDRYKQAFGKGLDYIFDAQYENGGWPQFFPVREAESVTYSAHITYNDNAMVNIMAFLNDIQSDNEAYASLQLTGEVKSKARKAFNMGVNCILKTQIMVNNQPTVWCAQHDEKTLAPAKARTYELASFSGAESVGITRLLMHIENPSEAIMASINGAVQWFETNKIEGIRLDTEIDKEGKKNSVIVADKNASPLWARFYDLETSKPYFCDRDGIKKNSMAELSYERRNGYGWYTDAPGALLEEYPEWRKKWNAK